MIHKIQNKRFDTVLVGIQTTTTPITINTQFNINGLIDPILKQTTTIDNIVVYEAYINGTEKCQVYFVNNKLLFYNELPKIHTDFSNVVNITILVDKTIHKLSNEPITIDNLSNPVNYVNKYNAGILSISDFERLLNNHTLYNTTKIPQTNTDNNAITVFKMKIKRTTFEDNRDKQMVRLGIGGVMIEHLIDVDLKYNQVKSVWYNNHTKINVTSLINKTNIFVESNITGDYYHFKINVSNNVPITIYTYFIDTIDKTDIIDTDYIGNYNPPTFIGSVFNHSMYKVHTEYSLNNQTYNSIITLSQPNDNLIQTEVPVEVYTRRNLINFMYVKTEFNQQTMMLFYRDNTIELYDRYVNQFNEWTEWNKRQKLSKIDATLIQQNNGYQFIDLELKNKLIALFDTTNSSTTYPAISVSSIKIKDGDSSSVISGTGQSIKIKDIKNKVIMVPKGSINNSSNAKYTIELNDDIRNHFGSIFNVVVYEYDKDV